MVVKLIIFNATTNHGGGEGEQLKFEVQQFRWINLPETVLIFSHFQSSDKVDLDHFATVFIAFMEGWIYGGSHSTILSKQQFCYRLKATTSKEYFTIRALSILISISPKSTPPFHSYALDSDLHHLLDQSN